MQRRIARPSLISIFFHFPLARLQAAASKLFFGADNAAVKDKRIVTCQTLSGTGALTLAAHFIKRTLPGRAIYCSEPTWENHGKVVADAGLGKLGSYRYWDAGSRGLDYSGMIEDLKAMPEGSIVILHSCAHNPTGEASWAGKAVYCALAEYPAVSAGALLHLIAAAPLQ